MMIGLMWVFPFLIYQHAYQINTFYQETSASLLALLSLPVLLKKSYWHTAEIPCSTLLPLGFVLLVTLQYSLGMIAYWDQAWLLIQYFLLATLLIMLGHYLRETLGLPQVVTTLAIFLVVGTELNALAGLLQHYHWHTFLNVLVTAKISSAVYGNVAQPNQYANYLMLGLISLGLLGTRGSLRWGQITLLALPLLFVMVLSGSRTSWLYQIFLVGMAFFWQRRDPQYTFLFRYCLLLLLGFAAMHWVVQLPWFLVDGSTTPLERILDYGGKVDSARIYLWREALWIFSHHPWLGAGFGQFAWQHFTLVTKLSHAPAGLFNNAHNLVLQFAAETGVAGLLLLFASVGWWGWQAWQTRHRIERWWGYGILAILAIHSLLEYPLWYLYFLGIAAFTIGLTEHKTYRLAWPRFGQLTVATLLLLGALSLAQTYLSYKKLEAALAVRPSNTQDIAYSQRVRAALSVIYQEISLRSYAELFLTGLIQADANNLPDKLAMNQRAMHFVPIASVVYRQAYLLALNGQYDEAKQQMYLAILAYPQNIPAAQQELADFARKDPEHFSALLEFATQKFEEYQRGIY